RQSPAHLPPHSFPTRRSSDLPRHHAATLIQFDDDQQFRLTPGGPITPPLGFVLALALLPPGRRADFRTSAIDEHAQTLACPFPRSEEHTSELQSRVDIVCRLL